MRFSVLAACLVALALATPAPARSSTGAELTTDAPVRAAKSSTAQVDVFYLVGEVGARETYTVKLDGPAVLTLFGPDGSELLTTSGQGTVTLEALLPFTDVFTLSVARPAPGAEYSLSRRTTVPTLAEAAMAWGVGYRWKGAAAGQCWLTPGVRMRSRTADTTTVHTLAADRTTIGFVERGSKGSASGEMVFWFEGDQLRMRRTLASGAANEHDVPFTPAYDPAQTDAFTGYHCGAG